MIHFNNTDKRWLEIIFYLICKRIYENNYKISDVTEFITGYRWTNMFNYDKLIRIIEKENILFNTEFIPSKQELQLIFEDNTSRLRIPYTALKRLLYNTKININRCTIFRAKMVEEIAETTTTFYPRLTTPKAHATIYSFLLALRFIADIVKFIKF